MQNQKEATKGRFWDYQRYVVAVLLIVAAVLKIRNSVEILASDGLLSSRPFLIFVIAFESAAATYLVIGNRFVAWLLTVTSFSIFAVFAAYAILSQRDCNCLTEHFPPPLVLAVDVIIVTCAFVVRPGAESGSTARLLGHLAVCLLVSVVFAGIATGSKAEPASGDEIEYLIADMMVNKSWPLTSVFHDDLSSMKNGRWMVLVVRRDCEHCRSLVAEHFSDPERHRDGERTAVFVAGETTWPFQFDRVGTDVDESTIVRWPGEEPFVASPAIFLLEDGLVTNAADGTDADAFLQNALQQADL